MLTFQPPHNNKYRDNDYTTKPTTQPPIKANKHSNIYQHRLQGTRVLSQRKQRETRQEMS